MSIGCSMEQSYNHVPVRTITSANFRLANARHQPRRFIITRRRRLHVMFDRCVVEQFRA
jgi:hypothetical protein